MISPKRWPPAGPEWYYVDNDVALAHGDCREVLPSIGSVDVVVTDPPYGDTSLSWDQPVRGWLDLVDSPQLWTFASMRFLLEHGQEFEGWTYGRRAIGIEIDERYCSLAVERLAQGVLLETA